MDKEPKNKRGRPKTKKSQPPAFFVNKFPIPGSIYGKVIKAYGKTEGERVFYRAHRFARNPIGWISVGMANENKTGKESYIHSRHKDEYDNKLAVEKWIAETIGKVKIEKKKKCTNRKADPSKMGGVLDDILSKM